MEADDARQVPVARMFVVCADAVLRLPRQPDLSDGYWEIHNPLHTVWMPRGTADEFVAVEFQVYLQITDGLGEFTFGIWVEEMDLANPRRDRIWRRSEPIRILFESPWNVVQAPVKLEKVPFPRPGQYRFRLLSDGREIEGGVAYIRVLPGANP